MVFVADTVNFREIALKEALPLTTIQQAVLEFLRERADVVLCGAHAINAYVSEPRLAGDVDLLATNAAQVAEELREFLDQRFKLALEMRIGKSGLAYRLVQPREREPRHLVDVRIALPLPPAQWIERVQVLTPTELIAAKVGSWQRRRSQAMHWLDWRDLAVLLLAFPELKRDPGPVTDCLQTNRAHVAAWRELVAQNIQPEADEDEFQ